MWMLSSAFFRDAGEHFLGGSIVLDVVETVRCQWRSFILVDTTPVRCYRPRTETIILVVVVRKELLGHGRHDSCNNSRPRERMQEMEIE